MSVKLENYSVTVSEALEAAVIAYLHEAANEVEAMTKRNTRPVKYGRHNVKSSWGNTVDEGKKVATVGSPLEAAYWEELGTGSHALNKDGRKGWWVYVEGNDTPRPNQQYYTEEEAKAVAASMRDSGLDAHATDGTEPNRPLHRAFESKKGWLRERAAAVLGEKLE